MTAVPENLCVMPWIAVDRNRNSKNKITSLTPCCLYEFSDSQTNINEYWNSDEIIRLRKDMQENKRPAGCNKCWKHEDQGVESLRQSINKGRLKQFQHILSETVLTQSPSQIKYTPGTECNLSCRMCLPNFSSRVEKLYDIIGIPYENQKDNLLNNFEYIIQNKQNIRFLDISGGEPFYHKKTKQLLLNLIESGDNKHITLFVTTNATRIDPDTVKLLKKFEDVVLSISLDGVGKVHEYIRPGCNWEQLENNIKLLKRNKISLQIISTISVLTILNLTELEEWCSQNNLHFANPSIVTNPIELAPHNLPYQLHQFVPKKYKNFIKKEISHDSLNFIKTLDDYWKTDIVEAIPQWKHVVDNLHWRTQKQLNHLNEVAKNYVG